jgi:hypothetical protein
VLHSQDHSAEARLGSLPRKIERGLIENQLEIIFRALGLKRRVERQRFDVFPLKFIDAIAMFLLELKKFDIRCHARCRLNDSKNETYDDG